MQYYVNEECRYLTHIQMKYKGIYKNHKYEEKKEILKYTHQLRTQVNNHSACIYNAWPK